jgi:hypothetical protein
MKIMLTLFLSGAAVMNCACLPTYSEDRLKIDPRDIHFLDSSTESPIAEVLVIPHYVKVESRSTPFKRRDDVSKSYVSNPFLYRKGKIPRPLKSKSQGIVWIPGCLFTGKEIFMEGALVLAPGYQPQWFRPDSIDVRKGQFFLNPISEEKSTQVMEDVLKQISEGTLRMPLECSRYYRDPCTLEVRFKKKELERVRSYLQGK